MTPQRWATGSTANIRAMWALILRSVNWFYGRPTGMNSLPARHFKLGRPRGRSVEIDDFFYLDTAGGRPLCLLAEM